MAHKKAASPKTEPSKHLTGTTHKDRAQWYFSRSTFPLRDAPPVAIERFWDHLGEYNHVPGAHWKESGPSNIAGRVTCLLMDPGNPQRMYAGTAAGGVWTSANGGDLWTSCWPRFLTHNIGALAIDPQNGDSLLCATGEGNLSADTYPGGGIFSSNNAGLTWSPKFTLPGGQPLDEAARAFLPRRIGTIAFGRSPEGPPRIALGSISDNETMPAALYVDQGSAGLQPVTHWSDRNYNCYSVVFDPRVPGKLYAAIQAGGTRNGIWLTGDFGKSWRHLTKGLPLPELCQRISLVMTPGDPDVLYALIARTITHTVLGVFKSVDGGASWKEVSGIHFRHETQLSYNNCVAVHPSKPDFVVCGATDLHISEDGGKTWRCITTGVPGGPNYCHNDHHAIAITPDGTIYSGNDGGVAVGVRTKSGAWHWQSKSEGMVTAMFYAADVSPANPKIFGGGTVDNGTVIAGVPASPGERPPKDPYHFARVIDGDGGWIRFDPVDADLVYGTTSDFTVFRHRRGEAWAKGDLLAPWKEVPVKSKLLNRAERASISSFVIEIEPATHKAPRSVYLGTERLWCTSNQGRTWRPVSKFFDGSIISAIAICSRNHGRIVVGTAGGGIYRTLNGGETWSANIAGAAVPRRLITRIAFHPVFKDQIVLTTGSTGIPGVSLSPVIGTWGASPDKRGAARPFGHVFISLNGGDDWQEIDRGQLPDVVYNALAFETQSPYRIFVGGDVGVWVTTSDEVQPESLLYQWASLAGNMPNVVVSDLDYNHKHQILTATTFGRGIWRTHISEPLCSNVEKIPVDPGDPGPSAVGLLEDPRKPAPAFITPLEQTILATRKVQVSWSPVEAAIGYAVEAASDQFPLPGIGTVEAKTILEFSADAQQGSCRVWALFPASRRSPGSATRTFRFSAGAS